MIERMLLALADKLMRTGFKLEAKGSHLLDKLDPVVQSHMLDEWDYEYELAMERD